MSPRTRLALLAAAAIPAASAGWGQQQLVARAPTGVTPEAERLLAANVEPRRLRLIEGDKLLSVARRSCGRLTETYLSLLREANAGKEGGNGTVVLPACFASRIGETVKVEPGETWGQLAARSTGAYGAKTLSSIFTANAGKVSPQKSLWSVAAAMIPGNVQEVSVPVTTEGVAYTPKAGVDAATLASQLRAALNAPSVSSLGPALPQPADELTLEAGVPPGVLRSPVCPTTWRAAPWPFPADEVAAVIARNEAHLGSGGMRPAVVAVVDNGVDGLLGTAFPVEDLEVTQLERAFPSDRKDQDGNGFFDDVVGTNIYQQGMPTAYQGGASPAHGTMMASLVLGGRDYRSARRLAAAPVRVRIRPVSIVRVSVVPGANGNVTTYGMPTEAVAKAVNYADAAEATIVNLSVSTPNRLSELEDALYNRSNLLLIVAAGNAATDLDAVPRFPASLSAQDVAYRGRVVTVAAHGRSGCLSGFSSRGPETVDLAAPGEQIAATGLGGGEIVDEGTSQATAITAFTAGNLRAAGLKSAAAIKERLLASVDLDPAMHGRIRSEGVLNVPKALSIFEDVLEVGVAPRHTYGHLSKAVALGDVCPALAGDPREVLKVSRRVDGGDSSTVRVLVRMQGKRGFTRPLHCAPVASRVAFTALDGTQTTFAWSEVVDLVPAL